MNRPTAYYSPNAYLPTHETNSSEEYRECLDVIHDIIQKYRESHVIFLCGDLNGTLLQSRINKHDRLLKELNRELDLTTNIGIGSQLTFFHHGHNSESQIDYILTTNKDMIKDYTISEKGAINISAHVPVTVTTAIQLPTIPKNIRQHKLVKQKIVWDQIDNEKYNENITANLKDIDDFQNFELKIQKITEAILLAQKEAIPTKSINMKGPRWKASPQVLEQLRKCKSIYAQWVNIGKPQIHPLIKQQVISEKRNLRRQQRLEQAIAKTDYTTR